MEENIKCGIYCIENITDGKKYIGLSRDIDRRWNEHIIDLNNNKHDNQYLQAAWNKYGENNFKFSIIELCTQDKLSERERYYINQCHSMSHDNGYNLTSGGENNSNSKPVISLKDKSIYNSVYEAADSCKITSITMIRWCKNKHNYMYLEEFNQLSNEEQEYWCNYDWERIDHEKLSRAHSKENLSEETIKKHSEKSSGANNGRAFKVYCPELDETFDCAKYASEKYGVNRGSIAQCIKGKLKSAGIHPITGERLTWQKV